MQKAGSTGLPMCFQPKTLASAEVSPHFLSHYSAKTDLQLAHIQRVATTNLAVDVHPGLLATVILVHACKVN